MPASKVCAALFLTAAAIVVGAGCKGADKPADSTPMNGGTNGPVTTMPTVSPTTTAAMPPTTMTVTIPNSVTPPIIVAPPAPTVTPTHVLTKDEPYFKSAPAEGATPDGTLKSGTKVLVFIPGGMYTKVTTDDGSIVYVATEGLDPISKK